MAIRERKLEPDDQGSGYTPPPSTGQSTRLSPFRRALEEYTDGLQAAWRPELASTRLNDAWRETASAPVPPAGDYAAGLEHHARIARTLQDAWLPKDAQAHFERLFTEFVNSVKAAWAGLDAAAVTPGELAAIASIIAHGTTFLAVPLQRQQEQPQAQ